MAVIKCDIPYSMVWPLLEVVSRGVCMIVDREGAVVLISLWEGNQGWVEWGRAG